MPQKPKFTYTSSGVSGYSGQAAALRSRSGQSHTGVMPTSAAKKRRNSAPRPAGISTSWMTDSWGGRPRRAVSAADRPCRRSKATSDRYTSDRR